MYMIFIYFTHFIHFAELLNDYIELIATVYSRHIYVYILYNI